jgi:hypothetical protein
MISANCLRQLTARPTCGVGLSRDVYRHLFQMAKTAHFSRCASQRGPRLLIAQESPLGGCHGVTAPGAKPRVHPAEMRRKTANRINFTPVREPRSHASLILVGTFAVILILGCGRGSEQNAATFRKTDLLPW